MTRAADGTRVRANKSAVNLTALVRLIVVAAAFWCGVFSAGAQTASTGAVAGTVSDPSGAVLPEAGVKVVNKVTGEIHTAKTQSNGSFVVALLSPGVYEVSVSKDGFKVATFQNVRVSVTEATTLRIRLQVGAAESSVTVTAEATQLQTTSTALGNVIEERMVNNLPLVTRNYTQILGLSPGVSGDVNNAAAIGRGNSGYGEGPDGYSVGGGNTADNNFQMNGSEVNDLTMSASGLSGGVPIPNPDSIQEFKVQTGQYDASYGRNAGGNVDVITKSGTNQYHGSAWEYFRNTVLNANDYFLNQQPGKKRGVLDQNQFGFALSGPIKKERLLFFGSYQGTRQKNGLSAGCLTTGTIPPGFTNDASTRTAAALLNEYQGAQGVFGNITPTSTISPTAVAVLNAQLGNGNFLIPASPGSGATTLSSPCTYNEDQFLTNVDYLTKKSHLSGKFFFANSSQVTDFPGGGFGGGVSVPGFAQPMDQTFRVFTLTHTYDISDHFLNQATIGFHRLTSNLEQTYPDVKFATQACAGSVPGRITLTSLCVPAPAVDDQFPLIDLAGAFQTGGNGQGVSINQNFYSISDSLSYIHGKHSLRFGGEISRSQINFDKFHYFAGLLFPTMADFLLGNTLLSLDLPGLFDREWRVWDGAVYGQDDYQVSRRLTLNLGLRYERQGAVGENLGRASTFDPASAIPNPPAAGSVQGYVVGSNFSGGAIPPGVIQTDTNTAINNDGQNTWGPRIGFSWQLPGTERMVLRGGYGIYYTRTTAQPFLHQITAPPFGLIRVMSNKTVATALPSAPTFPNFVPYSPTTNLTPEIFALNFHPQITQQYSMNLQSELSHSFMLEVGYRGARGTQLFQERAFNMAEDATVTPIRGQTTNTYANISLRKPILGLSPSSAAIIENGGSSWYNALTASLSKRFSRGLQFLASYTWASALETNPGYTTTRIAAVLVGDQSKDSNYGRDGFIRPQRFVVSYTYQLPGPADKLSWSGRVLAGWSVSGVTTFQSGAPLTLTDVNGLNAFGITSLAGGGNGDRAQLASGCANGSVKTPGSVTSNLNKFFNGSCIVPPQVIGADGIATGFGNSGIGIARGPGQQVWDISLIKEIPLGFRETSLEFRTEFFNVFNHPGFSNPNVSAGTVSCIMAAPPAGSPCKAQANGPSQPQTVLTPNASFGQITSTNVNPRIIQFALKFKF